MQEANLTLSAITTVSTSLRAKAFNIFASPGEVFEEIATAPPTLSNWRVPTLLVCFAGMILWLVSSNESQSDAISQAARASSLSLEQKQILTGMWPLISMLMIGVTTIAGSIWSAFVLWLIGRWFLKVRFPFQKALEVVGLTAMILLLGMIVTGLLISASGDVTARPSLSLLGGKLSTGKGRQLLDELNFFHLWTAVVMAVGLSKLSSVSFKEAAFWVFGYWVFVRIALIVLA